MSTTASHAAVGAITYTQMLNEDGGIECDFTITRLADERFRIVTGTAFGRHDLAWIRDHAPDDARSRSRTSPRRYACVGLWGPTGRGILQPLTPTDSALTFPYMRARELVVGSVPCLALRVTYVASWAGSSTALPSSGSALGHDLGGGPPTGIAAGGYKAVDSLRLEKGYRVWGSDIGPESERRTRAGSASASSSTRAISSGGARSGAARETRLNPAGLSRSR